MVVCAKTKLGPLSGLVLGTKSLLVFTMQITKALWLDLTEIAMIVSRMSAEYGLLLKIMSVCLSSQRNPQRQETISSFSKDEISQSVSVPHYRAASVVH